MEILLSTLNAKFIHSSLALAYLKEFCADERWILNIKEFSINEKSDDILASIFLSRPDILCFSCYIWNIKPILEICRDYKKIAPRTVIILGGPEVSYDAATILESHEFLDYIVRGEGEVTLKELLHTIYMKQALDQVRGISYRQGINCFDNPDRDLISDLDCIPSPYKGLLDAYRNRIVYYETSRGCPYNCTYCLSSTIKGVRFFSLERVKDDLRCLIKQGIKEIKFVDRTFNCHEGRAREIMEFVLDQGGKTKFHFEIGAERLSSDFMAFLKQVPPGRFDFEIGVQSTNPESLKAVNRNSKWKVLSQNIKTLQAGENIHIHIDLIAGLPYEDLESFASSFNNVYGLNPEVIQLGFLKLLKGSDIRKHCAEHNYLFQTDPPYQVLGNRYLGYADLLILKNIEDLLDRYYNSDNVPKSLHFIVNRIFSGNAFAFWQNFAEFWLKRELFSCAHKREAEYSILLNYIQTDYPAQSKILNELLKYDFLCHHQSHNIPEGIISHNPDDVNERLYILLKNQAFLEKYLYEISSKTPRENRRKVHLEYIDYDPFAGSPSIEPLPLLFVYDPVVKKASKLIKVPESYLNIRA
ncbi:MAG: B12-binding domain-containing radical SAM protein [Syntrophomonadaceae bacterium]|nr:B12-binding domain-containing radical SAM protein [Syntrophomonadaceae bacterium]